MDRVSETQLQVGENCVFFRLSFAAAEHAEVIACCAHMYTGVQSKKAASESKQILPFGFARQGTDPFTVRAIPENRAVRDKCLCSGLMLGQRRQCSA